MKTISLLDFSALQLKWIRKIIQFCLNTLTPNRWARKNQIEIYTDGSQKGKWGSWAFVIVRNGAILHESSGRVKKTNSHRMEFQAVVEALTYFKSKSQITIFSDSQVVIKSFTDEKWRKPNNTDQIELIEDLVLNHQVTWQWVKAHSGVTFNERCDQLCVQARS